MRPATTAYYVITWCLIWREKYLAFLSRAISLRFHDLITLILLLHIFAVAFDHCFEQSITFCHYALNILHLAKLSDNPLLQFVIERNLQWSAKQIDIKTEWIVTHRSERHSTVTVFSSGNGTIPRSGRYCNARVIETFLPVKSLDYSKRCGSIMTNITVVHICAVY